MIDDYGVKTPECWGDGLRLRDKFRGGHIQIDDADQVFTGGGKSDMTAFFRYRPMYEALTRRLAYHGTHKKILSLPASVGCEAYSLATSFAMQARKSRGTVEVHMADISDKKLRAADTGVYPIGFIQGIPEQYCQMAIRKDDVLQIDPFIKNMVKALPAFNVLDRPQLDDRYDLVMCLNLLCYLPELDDKITAAKYLASLTDDVLCLSHGALPEFEKYKDDIDAALLEEGFVETPCYTDYDGYKSGQVFTRQIA